MTLQAMEKSYITTSLHSTSYPFASGKAVPSFPIRLRLHGLVKLRFLLSVNARKPSD